MCLPKLCKVLLYGLNNISENVVWESNFLPVAKLCSHHLYLLLHQVLHLLPWVRILEQRCRSASLATCCAIVSQLLEELFLLPLASSLFQTQGSTSWTLLASSPMTQTLMWLTMLSLLWVL